MGRQEPGCEDEAPRVHLGFLGSPRAMGGGRSWAGGEEATITRSSEEAAEKVRSEGGWRVGSGLQPGKHNKAPLATGHFWSN